MTSPNRPHRSKKRKLMTASDIDEELQGVFDVSAESDTDISELSSENESNSLSSSDDDDNDPLVSTSFDWKLCDNIFHPQASQFHGPNSGITSAFPATPNSSESEYFQAYFDDEIMNILVEETNRYHQQCVNEGTVQSGSKQKPYANTDIGELYAFLALTMAMAQVKKHVLNDYWSLNSIIDTPLFRKYMTRHRYLQLLLISLLLLANNNIYCGGVCSTTLALS